MIASLAHAVLLFQISFIVQWFVNHVSFIVQWFVNHVSFFVSRIYRSLFVRLGCDVNITTFGGTGGRGRTSLQLDAARCVVACRHSTLPQ